MTTNEELAKRVEAGETLTADDVIPAVGCNKNMNVIRTAIGGDMNAALSLFEDLLPGWDIKLVMFWDAFGLCNIEVEIQHPYEDKGVFTSKIEDRDNFAAAIVAAALRATDKEEE